MGLLPNFMFDPQSFQGGIGGLLSGLQAPNGGMQMPQAYPSQAMQFQPPDPSQLPQNAQPAIGASPVAPPAQPPAAPQGPGFFGGLSNTIGSNPMTLMALGAGMMQGGIGKGLQYGLAGAQADQTMNLQKNKLTGSYEALVASGVPPALAKAASLNPEILKTIAPAYFDTAPKLQETGTNPLTGQKSFGLYRPAQGTLTPVGGATSGQPGGSTGFLAPGVGQLDSSLTGDDYLKQFSPEVQAAVKNYIGGQSMPTGNPRSGLVQTVKMVAQKYGADTGVEADDTTYAARRQMRNQLSSSSPSSLGGQLNIGNTAIGHLADLSDRALALGNYDTGIASLSHGINDLRGMTSAQSAKVQALQGAAQHYGQEITKFYAGSAGGEAERDRFLKSVNGAQTPQELAAVLSTEAELMQSRLHGLQSQIQGTLGPLASQYPVIRPESQTALAKLNMNITKLQGGTSGAAPAAAPAAGGAAGLNKTSNGVAWSIQ